MTSGMQEAKDVVRTAEMSLQFGHPADADLEPLADEDVPAPLWLGGIAVVLDDEGLPGTAWVEQNTDAALRAREGGATADELIQYAKVTFAQAG